MECKGFLYHKNNLSLIRKNRPRNKRNELILSPSIRLAPRSFQLPGSQSGVAALKSAWGGKSVFYKNTRSGRNKIRYPFVLGVFIPPPPANENNFRPIPYIPSSVHLLYLKQNGKSWNINTFILLLYFLKEIKSVIVLIWFK